MIEPAREILAFVKRQAESIRLFLWFHIANGFLDCPSFSAADLESVAVETLSEAAEIDQFQRCVHVSGALDYVLAGPFDPIEELYDNVPEAVMAPPHMQRMKLQAPLHRRWMEEAASDWTALRASTLSPIALRAFQTSLMVKWLQAQPEA